MSGFLVGAGNANSCLHTAVASVWPMEPYIQPWKFVLYLFLRFTYLNFMCMDVFSACITFMPGALEVKRGCWIPCTWNYRQLWADMWVLESKLRSSARMVSALNHCACYLPSTRNVSISRHDESKTQQSQSREGSGSAKRLEPSRALLTLFLLAMPLHRQHRKLSGNENVTDESSALLSGFEFEKN